MDLKCFRCWCDAICYTGICQEDIQQYMCEYMADLSFKCIVLWFLPIITTYRILALDWILGFNPLPSISIPSTNITLREVFRALLWRLQISTLKIVGVVVGVFICFLFFVFFALPLHILLRKPFPDLLMLFNEWGALLVPRVYLYPQVVKVSGT